MTKTLAVPLIVLAVAAAAIGGVVVARRVGSSSGSPTTTVATGDACPATTPGACTTLVADRFAIPAQDLPVLDAIPAGLTYESGRVDTASNGNEVAQFNLRATTTPHYLYQVGLVKTAPPTHDTAPIKVTPAGRRFRAVTSQPLGLKYVFYGPHVAVVVGVFGAPTRGTPVVRTADALLDSVRLNARQVDP